MTQQELLGFVKDAFTQGVADGWDLEGQDDLSIGMTYTEYADAVNGLLNEVYDMGVNFGIESWHVYQDTKENNNE